MRRTRMRTAILPEVRRSQSAHTSNSASHVCTSPHVLTTESIKVHCLQTLFMLSATEENSPEMNYFSYTSTTRSSQTTENGKPKQNQEDSPVAVSFSSCTTCLGILIS